MHYKNGREAKNGDKVMWIPDPKYGASPVVGILYNATAGQDYCNGQLAFVLPSDPTPNLKECLHLDDAQIALTIGQQCLSPTTEAKSVGEIKKELDAVAKANHGETSMPNPDTKIAGTGTK